MVNRGKRATKNHIKHAFVAVFVRFPSLAVGPLWISYKRKELKSPALVSRRIWNLFHVKKVHMVYLMRRDQQIDTFPKYCEFNLRCEFLRMQPHVL